MLRKTGVGDALERRCQSEMASDLDGLKAASYVHEGVVLEQDCFYIFTTADRLVQVKDEENKGREFGEHPEAPLVR